jgi:hypothetical protein
MRRAIAHRPSPAMVVALLSLFVALGGSGYAAVVLNGKNLKNRSVAGKKLKNNTLTGRQIRESTLGTVPRARQAGLLAGRAPRDFLTAGGTAVNARNLGGLAPSSWVRRECDQTSGQIKGVATISASATFPAAFTPVAGYNCSGQSVEARRLSMGRYEVRFNGSPVTQAVVTPVVAAFKADMASVTNQAPGLFTVYILDPLPAPGAFVDDGFTMITP